MKLVKLKTSIEEAQKNNLSYFESQKKLNSLEKDNLIQIFKDFYADKNIAQRFDWIINSIGISPTENNIYTIMIELTKIIPYIQTNYNLLLIGEAGLGKSSTYSLVLPFAKIVSGVPTAPALRGSEVKGNSSSNKALFENRVLVIEEAADSKECLHSIPLLKNTLSSQKFLKNNKDETSTKCSLIITSNEYSNINSFKELYKNIFTPLPSGIKDKAFLNRFSGTLPHYNNLLFSREYASSDLGIHCELINKLCEELSSFPNKLYHLEKCEHLSAREKMNINSTINGFVKLFYLNDEPDEFFLDFITQWAKHIISFNITNFKFYNPFTSKSLNFISQFLFRDCVESIEYICFFSNNRLFYKFKTSENHSNTNSKIIALNGFGVKENMFDLDFTSTLNTYNDYIYELQKEKKYSLSLNLTGDIVSPIKFDYKGNYLKKNYDQNNEFNTLLLEHLELSALKNIQIKENYHFRGIPEFYEEIIENKLESISAKTSFKYFYRLFYTIDNHNFKFINYYKIFNK